MCTWFYAERSTLSPIITKAQQLPLADIKAQGMAGVHLITAAEGVLPEFYAKYGFKKKTEVILMGAEF